MSETVFNNWQSIHDEVLRRIHVRQWKPGDQIPNEADLARQFCCSRSTVNRALQSLADAGFLERRRKAGTRVATHPVRKATLDIPVIRNEIAGRGHEYAYNLLDRFEQKPPPDIAARMKSGDRPLLHLRAMHMADGRPYVMETRWVDPGAVPGIENADFSGVSANEWLVENVPFTGGDIAFSAMAAGESEAGHLDCETGTGLFVIERSTWKGEAAITFVRLTFAPGYRMHTLI